MAPYLIDNPPARSQFRSPRRAPLRGVIELHDAESIMDTVGPDTGAENVARFIRGRDTPGSYHDLTDSDSAINLVDYDDEAYHDATGLNPSTTSLSFACRTIDWARMSPERRRGFLDQGARRAAIQARHQHNRTGKVVRPVRLTKAQVLAGETGFLYHGDSDPGRRSDPGTTSAAPFPWTEFVALYRRHAADLLGIPTKPPAPAPKPKPIPPPPAPAPAPRARVSAPSGDPLLRRGATGPRVAQLQTALNYGTGAGLNGKGQFGAATEAAVRDLQTWFRATRDPQLVVDGVYGPSSQWWLQVACNAKATS